MCRKIVSEEQFRQKAKTWLNHKLILSKSSQWYKNPRIFSAVEHVRAIFNNFLLSPGKYNVCELAIKIKKHEDILMAVLPMPGNPSYDNAFAALTQLIRYSSELIKQQHLEHLL